MQITPEQFEKMTIVELKALAYDESIILSRTQNNINIINTRIELLNKLKDQDGNIPVSQDK